MHVDCALRAYEDAAAAGQPERGLRAPACTRVCALHARVQWNYFKRRKARLDDPGLPQESEDEREDGDDEEDDEEDEGLLGMVKDALVSKVSEVFSEQTSRAASQIHGHWQSLTEFGDDDKDKEKDNGGEHAGELLTMGLTLIEEEVAAAAFAQVWFVRACVRACGRHAFRVAGHFRVALPCAMPSLEGLAQQ